MEIQHFNGRHIHPASHVTPTELQQFLGSFCSTNITLLTEFAIPPFHEIAKAVLHINVLCFFHDNAKDCMFVAQNSPTQLLNLGEVKCSLISVRHFKY